MPTVEQVQQALKEVLDPEYPVSVWDLGLIRAVQVEGQRVRVRVTYTSLGCPCTELIQQDIRERLLQLEGVREVTIEESFEPWSRGDISAEGILRLREIGVV